MAVLTIKAGNKDIKKKKKLLQTILFIILQDFLMIEQILPSPNEANRDW